MAEKKIMIGVMGVTSLGIMGLSGYVYALSSNRPQTGSISCGPEGHVPSNKKNDMQDLVEAAIKAGKYDIRSSHVDELVESAHLDYRIKSGGKDPDTLPLAVGMAICLTVIPETGEAASQVPAYQLHIPAELLPPPSQPQPHANR